MGKEGNKWGGKGGIKVELPVRSGGVEVTAGGSNAPIFVATLESFPGTFHRVNCTFSHSRDMVAPLWRLLYFQSSGEGRGGNRGNRGGKWGKTDVRKRVKQGGYGSNRKGEKAILGISKVTMEN